MTDQQLTTRKAMCYVLALLLLSGAQSLSSATNSNRQELHSMIEMYSDENGSDPVALVESVWTSQDLDLVDDCIWSGQSDLETAIKVRFGSAADSPFKDAVTVRLLQAAATYWSGDRAIPSTGTGTVDFAMQRAILDVISRNLGPGVATLEDLKDGVIRKELAHKLEASLNGAAYRGSKNGRRENSKTSDSVQRGNVGQEAQDEVPRSTKEDSLVNRLLIIVVLGLSAAISLAIILSRVRRAKSESITRRRS